LKRSALYGPLKPVKLTSLIHKTKNKFKLTNKNLEMNWSQIAQKQRNCVLHRLDACILKYVYYFSTHHVITTSNLALGIEKAQINRQADSVFCYIEKQCPVTLRVSLTPNSFLS